MMLAMLRTTLRTLAIGIIMAAAALAASADGTWKATYQSPDGQSRESTFVLKTDGEKVTGTLSSRMGESKIENGTLKGDNIEFSAVRNFNGTDVTFKYSGTITGNTMKLKVTAGDRELDMTATKQ